MLLQITQLRAFTAHAIFKFIARSQTVATYLIFSGLRRSLDSAKLAISKKQMKLSKINGLEQEPKIQNDQHIYVRPSVAACRSNETIFVGMFKINTQYFCGYRAQTRIVSVNSTIGVTSRSIQFTRNIFYSIKCHKNHLKPYQINPSQSAAERETTTDIITREMICSIVQHSPNDAQKTTKCTKRRTRTAAAAR